MDSFLWHDAYYSDLQSLYALLVAPLAFLAWRAAAPTDHSRAVVPEAARFVSGLTLVFAVATMIDPISTEDTDNHATESYVLSVADYGGKGIHNFLYGPITWHTYAASKGCSKAKGGCKLLDNAPFEYGGTFKVPGKPFHAMGANIN